MLCCLFTKSHQKISPREIRVKTKQSDRQDEDEISADGEIEIVDAVF